MAMDTVKLENKTVRKEWDDRVLEVLEKKSLISIDYRSPLKGCKDGWYLSCPVQGSLALTARGQQVLDLIDYQGII